MRSWVLGCVVLAGVVAVQAQDAPKTDKPAEPPAATPATKPLPGQQDLEDAPEVLKPVKGRTLAEDNRLKTGAWLATGRILEAKSDAQGALDAYKKALAFDPQSAEVYRAMVGAAVKLNMQDEALEWAEKVSELDPEEYMLRVQLGQFRMQKRDPAGALKFWEEALKSPRFKKESPGLYVTLNREIAIIYLALGRKDDAAKSLEIVFTALTGEAGLSLDFESRTKLLGNDPAGMFEQLGEVFLEAKRHDLAIKAFEEAAERKPSGSASLNYNMARVHLETDKAEQALEELQKYFDAQRQAKGRAAYALLGDILKKLNKSDELLSRLETLAEKDTRNSDLQYYLADQYRDARRLDDAERVYRKTLLFAAELQGYQGLASVLRQKAKPAELLDTLGKAYAKTDPLDIDVLETELKAVVADEKLLAGVHEAAEAARKDNRLEYPASVVAASLLAEAKKNEPAAELYRYALSLRKEKDAYFGLVDVLFNLSKYADAVKVLEEAKQQGDPDDRVNYIFTLVRAKEFAGDTDGALRDLSELKRINPVFAENDQIAYQEAWIYYHAHRYDEAIPLFEKLIAKAGNSSVAKQARFSLSNIYVLQGDYRKGEQILEEVYKQDPDDPSVNNDLGYLYADQGKNLEQAESMIKKAIAKEPDNGAYLDSMGWVLFKLGKVQEAIPYLEKAVQKSTGGGDETLYDHLGDAYDKAQQPAKALEAWKTALKHAKDAGRPDEKLIKKVEEKIKAKEGDSGKLKPAQPDSP